MITGFSIDFDKLPTQALKNLLANDVLLGERSQITVDDIIRICEILVTREKTAQTDYAQ